MFSDFINLELQIICFGPVNSNFHFKYCACRRRGKSSVKIQQGNVFVNLLLLFIGTCIVTIADLCFIDFSVWFFDARTFRRHFNYVFINCHDTVNNPWLRSLRFCVFFTAFRTQPFPIEKNSTKHSLINFNCKVLL